MRSHWSYYRGQGISKNQLNQSKARRVCVCLCEVVSGYTVRRWSMRSWESHLQKVAYWELFGYKCLCVTGCRWLWQFTVKILQPLHLEKEVKHGIWNHCVVNKYKSFHQSFFSFSNCMVSEEEIKKSHDITQTMNWT